MSFLPILLLIFLLSKSNNNTISSILNYIDLESISPVLEVFGLDKNIINVISSQEFKEFLNGNRDFKVLLPLIPTLLKNFNSKTTKHTQSNETIYKSENLTPIQDIASEEVYSTLGSYFSV